MVRGRLVGLNGDALTKERLEQTDGLSREVNFTQSAEIPSDNKIVDGEWWSTDVQAEFSMELEVAQELGVKVGDVIEFSIGGIKFESTLSSIREVNWQSMKPNFFHCV